jgi:hypothetical protein
MHKPKIPHWAKKSAQWGTAITGYYWFAKFWDYILYTTVVLVWGPFLGGGIMLAASFLLDLGSVKAYIGYGKDFLGMQEFRRRCEGTGIVARIVRAGDPAVFLVGSAISNPFIVTIYLKKGDGKTMTKRDWAIFLSSYVLSNAVWIGVIYIPKAVLF